MLSFRENVGDGDGWIQGVGLGRDRARVRGGVRMLMPRAGSGCFRGLYGRNAVFFW